MNPRYEAEMLCITVLILGMWAAYSVGNTQGRQSVEAVACTPNVDGLMRNGREVPLTSAQRDSLAMRTR